jgi:hypothetical protein
MTARSLLRHAHFELAVSNPKRNAAKGLLKISRPTP